MTEVQAPHVSVVLPTHNRSALLEEAAGSLLAQTFADWEAIVVDDASTQPATLKTVDPRLHIVRHSAPRGGAAAKNTGIWHARGEIVAFLDDDDLYARNYLARAVEVLRLRPELDVVFMGVTWFGKHAAAGQQNYDLAMQRFMAAAKAARGEDVVSFGNTLVQALLKSVPMAMQRPVVRRAALERIGLYREQCLLWDCDWAIRAALRARVALLPEALYRQRADRQGYSSHRERLHDQLRSNIDIKDTLWCQSHRGEHPEYETHFRAAAADAHFQHAWHLYQDGRRWRSITTLACSAQRKLQTRHLKLLLRLLGPTGHPTRSAPEQTGTGLRTLPGP